MSKDTRRHLKAVGTRTGIMYGSFKGQINVSMAAQLSD